jgi:mannose-6-phosphate isomerase-like protein (cupin superfamily)
MYQAYTIWTINKTYLNLGGIDVLKVYTYSDGQTIELYPDNKISIKRNIESLEFNEINKPQFDNGHGETVVEYTGLCADGKQKESWGKASYNPESFSQLHYHQERTEDYYIVSGNATVIIDSQEHHLTAGSHIRINPMQQHQVINASKQENLQLIVKCVPAWVREDFHLVTNCSMTNCK